MLFSPDTLVMKRAICKSKENLKQVKGCFEEIRLFSVF
jgi:hypothetical protein